MHETDFTYAVARVRYRETKLLSDADVNALLDSKDAESAVRLLRDRGWGDSSRPQTTDELLRCEEDRIWDFVRESVDDEMFDYFLVPRDFHNLKVTIKAITRGVKPDEMFLHHALTDPADLFDAVEKREYDRLPAYLIEPAKQAMQTLLETSDGQLCDMILDKACMETVYSMGNAHENDTISLYCELYVVSADIKIAVRSAKTGKCIDFIRRSLAPCRSLDTEALANAAALGFDDVMSYLSSSKYHEAVPYLQQGLASFEKWCDDYLTECLFPQKWEPFSIGPIVAYVIARQNEIKAVRMILSGKMNALDSDTIKERLRKMYV